MTEEDFQAAQLCFQLPELFLLVFLMNRFKVELRILASSR